MSGPVLAEVGRLRRLEDAARKSSKDEAVKLPLSDLPFDPTIGAEQLAHAKQRIRDQRQEIAHLQGHLGVLNDAMARRQDILDYVKQMVVHDTVTMNFIHDEGKRSEYQKMFLSVLDGDRLHGMSAAAERQLLDDQLVTLRERVRMLDARDATKSKAIKEKDQRFTVLTNERDELALQLTKAKLQHTSLYHVLQETKEDLNGSQDHLSQTRREADMLRKTLDATLADLKGKEHMLSVSAATTKSLQDQLDAMSSQTDTEKRAAAESMRGVTTLLCDIAKTAEQSAACERGSPVWLTFMQLSADAVDKGIAAIGAIARNAAGEQLKPLLNALSIHVTSARALAVALGDAKAKGDAVLSEIGGSCEVKLAHANSLAAAVGPNNPSGSALINDAVAALLSSSPIALPQAEQLVSSLALTIQKVVGSWIQDRATLEGRCDELQRVIDEKAATPPVQSPVTVQTNPVLLQTVQSIRNMQDKQLDKLFSASKPRDWSDQFDDFLTSMHEAVAEFRQSEKLPFSNTSALELVVEALAADLSAFKSAKRDIQRLRDANRVLEEAAEAAASSKEVPPIVAEDPSLPLFLAAVAPAIDSLKTAQRTLTDSCEPSSYVDDRHQVASAIRRAVESCEGSTVVGESSRDALQTILVLLRCLEGESEESQCLWHALTSIDDPISVQALRDGKAPTNSHSGKKHRHVGRLLAADLHRVAQGQSSMVGLVEKPKPKRSPKVIDLTPPAPHCDTSTTTTQTDPEKVIEVVRRQQPPSVEDAVRIVKAAGMWPPSTLRRSSGFDEGSQATARASRRATQTVEEVSPAYKDASTSTDASLLTQYLGITTNPPAGSVPQKQRSASVIQIFGDRGEVEQVGSIVGTDQLSSMHRTTSSIPSKHSAPASDFVVGPSRSMSFTRKHSIPSLLARQSVSHVVVSREDDDASSTVESVVIDAAEAISPHITALKADVPTAAAHGEKKPREVSNSVFNLDVDTHGSVAMEAPADFYAMLGAAATRRPSSSNRRASCPAVHSLARPSSATSMTLRERSKELAVLSSEIRRTVSRKPSEIALRSSKIRSLVQGAESAHEASVAVEPVNSQRRSIRDMARAGHISQVLDAVAGRSSIPSDLGGWE